jgi:uncharacterized repeat protein (TIGR02543 family)
MRRFKTQSILTRAALTLLLALMTCATAWATAEVRTYTFEYNASTDKSYLCCNGSSALLGTNLWVSGTATLGDITSTFTWDDPTIPSRVIEMNASAQQLSGYVYQLGGNHSDFNYSVTSSNKYIVHVILYHIFRLPDYSYELRVNTADNSSKTFSYYWETVQNTTNGNVYKIELILNDNNQPAYKINYELDGGTNASSNPDVYEKSAGATLANPTKQNHTFLGWYRNSNFSGSPVTSIPSGSTGDVTLYAKWQPISCTITFQPGTHGLGTMDAVQWPYNENYTLPACGFTGSGYHFTGWMIDGNMTLRSPGYQLKIDSDKTLTAAWDVNHYTVHYDANGGTGTMADQSFVYGQGQRLPYNDFVRPGYLFTGWNTKQDGTGTSYTDNEYVNIATETDYEVVTLFAQWRLNDYYYYTSGDTCYICDNAGWNVFCDMLESGETFENKVVFMKYGPYTSDYAVKRCAGTSGHEFKGTFDGNGKTLYIAIDNTGTQGTAPFREIIGATIKNLTVQGSVNGGLHCAGLVGFARSGTNTIENCYIKVNVTNPATSGNRHIGGVVGHGLNSTIVMRNTVYDGTMSNTGSYAGGLQGWSDGNTLTLDNCLFAGNYSGNGQFHPVAIHNTGQTSTATVHNVLYSATPTLTNTNYIAAAGDLAIVSSSVSDGIGSVVANLNFMNVYTNGFYYNRKYYKPAGALHGSGTESDPYLIRGTEDWDYFCDALQDNDTWNRFSGKYVKLVNDITVKRMAGSNGHEFMGTFDGNGKALNIIVNVEQDYAAPFTYVNGATIKNLNITGSITNKYNQFTGGLIAVASGNVTVTNCKVSCKIYCNFSGDGFNGGFIAKIMDGQTTFTDCIFDGTLDGRYTRSWAGFVSVSTGDAVINHSLFAPSGLNVNEIGGATFVRGGGTLTECYYITPLGDAQGILAYDNPSAAICTPITIQDRTIYCPVDLTLFGTDYDPLVDGSEEHPFLIDSTESWNFFCDCLQDNDTWNRFSGKYVKLYSPIDVSRMAGSSNHDFCGTFDGNNLYILFSSTEDANGVAPFSYISNTTPVGATENAPATIKNLTVHCNITTSGTYVSGLVGRAWGELNIIGCTVEGSINTSNKYAASFIGQVNNTPVNIIDCCSWVTINSTVEGDGTHGGLVAVTMNGSTTNIEGCMFRGLMLGETTTKCGGFVGWRGGTVNISNSIFSTSGMTVSDEGSATFCRNGANITNSYYLDSFGEEQQGKEAVYIVNANDITVQFSGDSIMYELCGIKSYGTGLFFDHRFLIAGHDDQVSLNIYGPYTGYAVSEGTLIGTENPYTLIMPNNTVYIYGSEALYQVGDVNHDNSIDIDDVTKLISMVLGLTPSNSEADCDGNNGVDIDDVTKLINFVLSGHWN